ncbi:MAG TPA: MaoC/PaaZ C-terminal domain-containing protein [Actinophytocola sp.]|uniref:MaoC family dehydratase n=1 Tax=Actinophytocola sp. TaxID=1872138 RepID=UPI002F95D2B3
MAITELSSPPSLAALYPKAVLSGFRRRGGELPDTVYALPGVRIDPEHLAAYNRVCGFRLTDALPATYPHVLTFPLQVKLMTAGDFPFPLAGSVHVANKITQARSLSLGDELELRAHVANLRDHPRGKQFDMVSEALAGGEVVWTDVSTYLRRGGGSGSSSDRDQREPPAPTAIWAVPDDIGRRYGEVSGDRNPIHLHKLTAKMFGYPRAIAHGMWTKARCLAAFEGRLPEACTVDVRFKTPVPLPTKVGFAASPEGAGWRFELFGVRNGKPHVAGTIG